ncbi:MAG TPA: hypothetical protein VFB42_02215 [Gaiellaceae bacterium]|nr:hypothetical protein [Gaiellaceae bacterium]
MRRVATALVLAVLAGALAGCGGGVRETVDPVAAAATKSAQAGGVEMKLSMTIGTGAGSMTMEGHGAFERDRGKMELDLSSLLGRSGPPGLAGGSVKAVYLTESGDPVVYVDVPFLAGVLPGGKTWIRIDLERAGKSLGIDFDQLVGSSQSPAQTLGLLRSSGHFTAVGGETVDGVETTHYRGSVDLAEVAKAGGVPARAVEKLSRLGAPTAMPFDVWVDHSGLVRRIVERYERTVGGSSSSMEITIDLGNYGTEVEVSAPPSDEVFDVTELASKAAQQSGLGG